LTDKEVNNLQAVTDLNLIVLMPMKF